MIQQELMKAVKVFRENLKLDVEIDRINDEIEKNEQLIIKHFFPFLLSVYKKWKPFLEEKAMCIDLEKQCCFEVTIKNIEGDMLRTRVGDDDVTVPRERRTLRVVHPLRQQVASLTTTTTPPAASERHARGACRPRGLLRAQ